jgi:hypothetical protein
MSTKFSDVATWPKSRGKKELLNHLQGKDLSPKQAITAHCYDCNAGYSDGKSDCGVVDCALHPFMPYAKGVKKRTRIMSDDQRQAAGERLRRVRRG